MPSKTMSVWLPQVIFESALIVVSILVALGLDEWRESRQDLAVIRHALASFAIEIQQNKLRVEDATPFNQGLKNVLAAHYVDDDVDTVDAFVTMVESYNPVVLHSTAWETALATGSLAKMKYEIVSALSLTYSLQNRYQVANNDGLQQIMSPQNLANDKLKIAVYNSVRYLDGVTSMESELSVVYAEALGLLATELGPDMPGSAAADALPNPLTETAPTGR